MGRVDVDLLAGGLFHVLPVHPLPPVPLAFLQAEQAEAQQIPGGAHDAAARPGTALGGLNAPDIPGNAQGVQQGAHIIQDGHAGDFFHQAAERGGAGGVVMEDGARLMLVLGVIEEGSYEVLITPIIGVFLVGRGHSQQIPHGSAQGVGRGMIGQVFRKKVRHPVVQGQPPFRNQHTDGHGGEAFADGIHAVLSVRRKGGHIALRRDLSMPHQDIAVQREPAFLHFPQECGNGRRRDAQGFRRGIFKLIADHRVCSSRS